MRNKETFEEEDIEHAWDDSIPPLSKKEVRA
jgi:hypothetical protein